MSRLAPYIFLLGFCLFACRAGVQIRPDGRDLAMALDQVVLPVFACEGLSSAKAFAVWKESVGASPSVNMILQEQGEAGKGSVTLDLRGLSAFHVLKLLADRTGAQVEFTRNVLHVRLP